jgi:translation initiation factor IF-2
MDKEGADINRVKQQLAEQDLLVEEWGGDTVVQPVSAKTGEGIPALLDMILLVSDVEDLRAVVKAPAEGLIIEAHMEQGRGPIAHALIEEGTLKVGDFVVAGAAYAKVRALQDTSGVVIKAATPSTPVTIAGFKTLPSFGDSFHVVKNEKEARAQVESAETDRKRGSMSSNMSSNELLRIINRSNQVQDLNIIIRADVQGSLTSVIDSLKALETDEVAVRVVSSGVGSVTETDLHVANTSGAIIYGFNVAVPAGIKRLASRDKLSIRLFNVIYELIDDVRGELSKLLAPEIVETEKGRLVIKGIFKTTKSDVICGGEVTKGKLTAPSLARVTRGSDQLAEVEVTGLKRGPQEAKEVFEGEMCGVSLKTTSRLDLQEGDKVEFFTRETITRSL